MEKAISKRYKIKNARSLIDTDLENYGFHYVHSDFSTTWSGGAWEKSIYHHDTGTTCKVYSDDELVIFGLEEKVELTLKEFEKLVEVVEELNSVEID